MIDGAAALAYHRSIMTTEALKQRMSSYQSAYAPDVPLAERDRLVRQSVSDDVAFFTPMTDGRRIDNLIEHVGRFQHINPGKYFTSGDLVAHHGQLLSEWTLHDKDGAAVSSGHTYARFNENGRLTHLIGFFAG